MVPDTVVQASAPWLQHGVRRALSEAVEVACLLEEKERSCVAVWAKTVEEQERDSTAQLAAVVKKKEAEKDAALAHLTKTKDGEIAAAVTRAVREQQRRHEKELQRLASEQAARIEAAVAHAFSTKEAHVAAWPDRSRGLGKPAGVQMVSRCLEASPPESPTRVACAAAVSQAIDVEPLSQATAVVAIRAERVNSEEELQLALTARELAHAAELERVTAMKELEREEAVQTAVRDEVARHKAEQVSMEKRHSAEFDSLKAQLVDLQEKKSIEDLSRQEELENLKAQHAKLQDRVHFLQTQLEEALEGRAQADDMVHEMVAQNQVQLRDAEVLMEQYKEAKQSLQDELQTAKAALDEANAKQEVMLTEIGDLKMQLEDHGTEASAQEMLDTLKHSQRQVRDAEVLVAEHAKERQLLQEELEETKAALERQRQEMEEMHAATLDMALAELDAQREQQHLDNLTLAMKEFEAKLESELELLAERKDKEREEQLAALCQDKAREEQVTVEALLQREQELLDDLARQRRATSISVEKVQERESAFERLKLETRESQQAIDVEHQVEIARLVEEKDQEWRRLMEQALRQKDEEYSAQIESLLTRQTRRSIADELLGVRALEEVGYAQEEEPSADASAELHSFFETVKRHSLEAKQRMAGEASLGEVVDKSSDSEEWCGAANAAGPTPGELQDGATGGITEEVRKASAASAVEFHVEEGASCISFTDMQAEVTKQASTEPLIDEREVSVLGSEDISGTQLDVVEFEEDIAGEPMAEDEVEEAPASLQASAPPTPIATTVQVVDLIGANSDDDLDFAHGDDEPSNSSSSHKVDD